MRVRILFTFVGGRGHFEPLIPVARASEAAGHTVAFCGRVGMIPAITHAGFVGFPGGLDFGDTDARSPLLRVSLEREDESLREGFARKLARARAKDIVALCAMWQPDLIVCDEIDFGSMVAAEHLDLSHASVLVIAAGSFVRPEVVGAPLDELRASYGLPPDPDLEMLRRYLVLSPFPPSYRDPAFPLPATAHFIRPREAEAKGGEAAPEWLATLPDAPTVYFTLGTVFNRESGDLFSRALAGLRDLPINLIVTVGPFIDPAEFGAQPAHVHIERYIPQAAILPRCHAVVSHGGSGSVLGVLAHGLPMVLLPMGADQPHNAARCEALGVARVLDAVEATPDDIGKATAAALENAAYRQAAQRLRDEIAALPAPAHAVTLLERLAAEHQPILREKT